VLILDKIVHILKTKSYTNNDLFFKILTVYQFGKLTGSMRVNIKTLDRGILPLNLYCLNLANSGFGKGKSINLLEDEIFYKFKIKFLDTKNIIQNNNLQQIIFERASKRNEDPEKVSVEVHKEFKSTGQYLYQFDSGTEPALKQQRHHCLMSNIGSLNLEIDEIGSNISKNSDVLNTYLELYDLGKVKTKLIKNTQENSRLEDVDGRVPANLLMFGVPSKLLDNGKIEDDFFQLLSTGYARRLLFGYTEMNSSTIESLSAEELYELMLNQSIDDDILELADYFEQLATVDNHNKVIQMDKQSTIALMKYQIECDKRSKCYKEHEELKAIQMLHRYFNVIKVAGIFSFIKQEDIVSTDTINEAIDLIELSGEAFNKMLTREKPYVRLAKYIADIGKEVSQVDLIEDLPFYKGNKKELLDLAIAYGYKNNIIIKRYLYDNIEFLKGETIKSTDLNKLIMSYSNDVAYNYDNRYIEWDKLPTLCNVSGHHFTAHHWKNGHRNSANVMLGFNLVIIDVDKGINIDTATQLLKDYKYYLYSTKSHTNNINRFRIIFPLSHTLHMESKEYSLFMEAIFNWLPFEVDLATKDIARKWETNPGISKFNEGDLLDATLFIAKTKKNDDLKSSLNSISNLSMLERWFLLHSDGNRNNMLYRYAMSLLDNNYSLEAIRNAIYSFNNKLPQKLSEEEISSSVMLTVTKKYTLKEMNG